MRETRRFAHDPRSVTQARRFVTAFLADSSEEVRDTVEIMISELATNCVLHTNSDFTVTLDEQPGRLHAEVADQATGQPAVQPVDPTAMSGRGLRTVESLADSWGVRTQEGVVGKTVWFTLPLAQVVQEA